MSIFECIKSAFKNIVANKMRTALTMLGIVIGISSVILIVSIGNGSQAQIEKEFDSFGTGALTVSLTMSQDIETRDLLTMDDYYMLQDVDGLRYISPTYNGRNATVKLLDPRETKNADVTGVTSDYRYISNDTILYGRYISENDVEMRNSVCVIKDTTALQVFGVADESVIGQSIKVKSWKGTTSLTVIGMIENTNTTEIENPDEYSEAIVMPITTCMRVFTGSSLDGISVILDDPLKSEEMTEVIIAALSDFHGNKDKYYVLDMSSFMSSINDILSQITMFISFVAAISLIVGGIGVMNIMMVTVTERTREIGIRKAIGAKNRDIRIQFIIEAVMLTGVGGIVGLLFGWFGALGVGKIAGVAPVMSIPAILGAVSVSTVIGIIFGVAPANKAALLDPIEALRYE
ncbi:MAG: ABC transporter permease [Anaerotignaceae bacterium]